MKVKIVYDKYDGPTHYFATELIDVGQLSSYESLLDLFKKTKIIDQTNKYLIFLLDQFGEKVLVDKNNFDFIIKRIFDRNSEDDFYFKVQDVKQIEKSMLSVQSPENMESK